MKPKLVKKENTVPEGFVFAAGEAGLRTHGSGPDVALIFSTAPANVGACFTTNRVKAAPVEVSQEHLRRGNHVAQAIVVNAGNANCATGPEGKQAAWRCAGTAADLLSVPKERVLVASTGVIGVPLDTSRITKLLPALSRRMRPEGYRAVSRAILTTDTRPKVASRRLVLPGCTVRILGFSKGAGMIHPRMATMLGFLLTDAAVDPDFLREGVRRVCDLSFNRISVDGDTSTNDTVFLMANGLAGNVPLKANTAAGEKFLQALTEVAQQLAIEMVKDGEGARRLLEIRVEGAISEQRAGAIARAIGLSSLVKTAVAGADPNWGRILSAAGTAGVDFDPASADIYISGVRVYHGGKAANYNEPALQRKMRAAEVPVRFVLREGSAETVFWTCDLTEEYIRINASYRT